MPQSSHAPAAELHNMEAHKHAVAEVSHGQADHQTAHELSEQAHELSRNALKHSKQLAEAASAPAKTEAEKNEKVKAKRLNRPGVTL